MPSSDTDRGEWISLRGAAQLMEVAAPTARAILTRAALTRKQLPGCAPRYLRGEVEALVRASIRRPDPVAGFEDRPSGRAGAIPPRPEAV
jgi:hypothetical protein